jgi:hypothetical protein
LAAKDAVLIVEFAKPQQVGKTGSRPPSSRAGSGFG